jgi:thiamine biosynthesis protein ThiS
MEAIEITVNGAQTKIPAEQTIENLLTHLGIRFDRVAVEMNRSIVTRRQWASTSVPGGAKLEIVEFVGGG